VDGRENKVRCAVTGLGRIGSLLEDDRLREKPCTHAGAIDANQDCILVGGCDLNPARRRFFARRWNCPHVYAKVETMLHETKPDILHIATPPETHLDLVERALGSSVSVIICEKPLAPSGDDAAVIADHHRSARVRILTNHERRYSLDYLMVKDRIDGVVLGDLLSIDSKVYMGLHRPAVEMLLDDGTHLIDIIRFLTGSELELIGVDHAGVQMETWDMLFVRCEAGGVPVRMEIASKRDHTVFELDLSFTSGRIRIGNGIFEVHKSAKSPHYEHLYSLTSTGERGPAVTGYFANMLRDAVACARDPLKDPRSTAVDGFRAVEIIDRIREFLTPPGDRAYLSASQSGTGRLSL
jgi:predicted dehydrogenase